MPFPIVAVVGAISGLLERVIPDPQKAAEAKIKLAELVAKGESEELAALVQMTQAQTDILKIDATSQSMFQKGWRPLAGWAAVIGGVIYPLVRVFLPWLLNVAGVEGVPELPALDTAEIMAMLGGMLGLGTMRSVERVNGKA
jgi:hypothetical protein